MPMPICPFKASDLSPSMAELDWLYDWLVSWCEANWNPCSVVEFGCGITTWCIYDAAFAKDVVGAHYLCVEDFQPCVDNVKAALPKVVIENTWELIGKHYAELVFVDSSCGCGKPGLHREDCVKAVVDHQAVDDLLILHDWRGKSGKKAREYAETCGKYELIDAFMGRTGLGIYRRV